MRRVLGISLLLGLCVLPVPSQAVRDVGQFCWQTNFIDVINAVAIVSDGPQQIFRMIVTVIQRAESLYQLEGIGTVAFEHPGFQEILASSPILVNNTSGGFGGHPLCLLRLRVSYPSLNGTSEITCTGRLDTETGLLDLTVPPFVSVATLTKISCGGEFELPSPSALRERGVKAQGEVP